MSETDSFIQEVTEEVRQDRMYRLWKKYAPLAIGVVALIVAAAGGYSWYKHYQVQQARITGGEFIAAAIDSVAAEEKLVKEDDGPSKFLARMRLAAANALQNDPAAAAKIYLSVAAEPGLPRAYADLAKLEAVRVSMATMPEAKAEADLEPLIAPGAPYRLLALELRAAIRLNAGKTEAAHKDLELILDDSATTKALSQRATIMMLSSGGTLPQQPRTMTQ